jgi:heptosyltransferase I
VIPPANRIGIVMLSALGDTVHVLPIVTALKRHAPGTHITWILQPGPALLVEGHPAVDEVVRFDRKRGWRAFPALRRELGRRPPFDLVLALQPYFKAGIITALMHARVKLGFDLARARDLNWLFTTERIPARPQRHIQDQFFEFLDAIHVPHGEPEWGLAPTAGERARAQALVTEAGGAPLVGLVVATSKPPKNWMPERYGQLATRLHVELGAKCVLLGDTSLIEQTAAAAIQAQTTAHPINALGAGLRTTLALLDRCDVVVSPDTGPFHMCVAMNVPAVGLFGYTNPKRVGPYRRFGDLLVDAYGDPGEDYPVNMQYRPGRMERITVDQVMEKVKLALQRYPRGTRTSAPRP